MDEAVSLPNLMSLPCYDNGPPNTVTHPPHSTSLQGHIGGTEVDFLERGNAGVDIESERGRTPENGDCEVGGIRDSVVASITSHCGVSSSVQKGQ